MNPLPVYSFAVTTWIVFGILLLRYFLLSGTFYGLTRPQRKSKISSSSLRSDISYSLSSSAIFAFQGAGIIWALHHGYTRIDLGTGTSGGWKSNSIAILACLVLHDAYFYWTHRWFHEIRWLRNYHFVHHRSIQPSSFTSFAFHPVEAVIQAIPVPLLICIIPLHWIALLVLLMIMSILGVINHLGVELYPANFASSFATRYLVSATHHQIHHENFSKNLGLYFSWWDHWCGTEDHGYVERFDRLTSQSKIGPGAAI